MNYVNKIHYGAGLIAHACGVPHVRALERRHVRLVQPDGRSAPFDTLYPPVKGARRRGKAA
jgi:hypothetical protein